jgi:hypothetical protein
MFDNGRHRIHIHGERTRQGLAALAWKLPDGCSVEIRENTRTLPQNSRMWAILTEISKKVDWYGNRLSPEDWKTMFTAVLRKQRAVPGIEGGFVVLGDSTSRMTKQEMSDLHELMTAFAAERGLLFPWDQDPEEQMREASRY